MGSFRLGVFLDSGPLSRRTPEKEDQEERSGIRNGPVEDPPVVPAALRWAIFTLEQHLK